MFLSYVESAEVGDALFEGAPIVLEDGLVRDAGALADDITGGFFASE